MNRARDIDKYLKKYAVSPMRPLLAASVAGVDQAVVIPALAESSSLFRTLSCIAANPSGELRRTLVVCVVNNHRPTVAAEEKIRDNQVTLAILKELMVGRIPSAAGPAMLKDDLERIAGSSLRLGCIDASSTDAEIPDRDGGVGTARKIGMDAALTVLNGGGPGGGVICCLDADTLVMENYFAAVYAHFSITDDPAAVAGYAHQKPADPRLLAAICCYEIFLRAYVMGLSFAGSPYAFHAIGSTMSSFVCGFPLCLSCDRLDDVLYGAGVCGRPGDEPADGRRGFSLPRQACQAPESRPYWIDDCFSLFAALG
ncbi:MAG: hypothetical protein NTY86_06165 [Deltaproteobacteria bacterium]|nr:hypothetical protein [Deltaproteobacteria bacterium]